MNSKDNYKLSKDMNGAERLGTAVGAGIATIYCKCLNASDRAVIDRMKRDGYTDHEIEYYLKHGETPLEAKRRNAKRLQELREWNEKNSIAGTEKKKEKKGGFFSRLFGKKEEPKQEEEPTNIKINNGNDYGFSYSINE